jgi:hypothetical protein
VILVRHKDQMALVDQFNSLTLEDITSFIDRGQEENLLLEFKTLNSAYLDRDDRKNLAKALSGFANSSGGLIIWGLQGRPNDEGVDCAVALREIEPLPTLLAALNELTGQAVSPIVEGVQHRSLPINGRSGLAVTLVPESDSGPHMAKAGEDRYYKRSGDSFRKMEHFDLEDMFGRRKKPKLCVFTRVIPNRMEVVVGVKNEGRGTAKGPFLSFTIPDPWNLAAYGLDGNGHEGLPRLHQSREASRRPCYGGNSNYLIHPNIAHDIALLEFRGGAENRPAGEYTIEYEVAAEDMPAATSHLFFRFGVSE